MYLNISFLMKFEKNVWVFLEFLKSRKRFVDIYQAEKLQTHSPKTLLLKYFLPKSKYRLYIFISLYLTVYHDENIKKINFLKKRLKIILINCGLLMVWIKNVEREICKRDQLVLLDLETHYGPL